MLAPTLLWAKIIRGWQAYEALQQWVFLPVMIGVMIGVNYNVSQVGLSLVDCHLCAGTLPLEFVELPSRTILNSPDVASFYVI